MLPEQLEKVLQQVQANADYMPEWQLDVSARTGPSAPKIFHLPSLKPLYHVCLSVFPPLSES